MGRFESCPYDMDIVSEFDLSSKPTYVSRKERPLHFHIIIRPVWFT